MQGQRMAQRNSNLQSLVPKTDALSIRPQDPACKAKEGSQAVRGVQEDQDERRKNDGKGVEPAALASAVGLLARRSLTRRRKCPEADGNALPYRRQSPYRLVDDPGSTPGEDTSLGQSEEKKTCLHH